MKLYATFTVRRADGSEVVRTREIEIADDEIVRGYLIEVESPQGARLPIVAAPFYMHGARLHTICRLESPRIVDEIDW